jgi:hypothetical protein
MPAGPKPKANSIHLYGGLFAPIDVNAPSPTIGMRLGRRLGAHLQGGLLVDWTYERKNLEQPINGLPGLQPHLILARADGQLIPMMLFLEVSLTEKRYLVPYGGIAGGYEWLLLGANDYRNGASASATYSNIAWQGWAGVGIRLDPGLRFDVELNYNGGSLGAARHRRSGLREAVRVNGVGAGGSGHLVLEMPRIVRVRPSSAPWRRRSPRAVARTVAGARRGCCPRRVRRPSAEISGRSSSMADCSRRTGHEGEPAAECATAKSMSDRTCSSAC